MLAEVRCMSKLRRSLELAVELDWSTALCLDAKIDFCEVSIVVRPMEELIAPLSELERLDAIPETLLSVSKSTSMPSAALSIAKATFLRLRSINLSRLSPSLSICFVFLTPTSSYDLATNCLSLARYCLSSCATLECQARFVRKRLEGLASYSLPQWIEREGKGDNRVAIDSSRVRPLALIQEIRGHHS